MTLKTDVDFAFQLPFLHFLVSCTDDSGFCSFFRRGVSGLRLLPKTHRIMSERVENQREPMIDYCLSGFWHFHKYLMI